MRLEQNFLCGPKACFKTTLLLLTWETSVRDWCVLTQFQSASPFFVVVNWLLSHREEPWFFLFCWPLCCWEITSRVLVQTGCNSSTDCCVKNLLPFLDLRWGWFCLPAPFCSSHKDNIVQAAWPRPAGVAGHLRADQRPTLL